MKIEIDDLKKVNLGPDDVLVFSIKDRIELEVAKKIYMYFKRSFPSNKMIILEDGATLEVIKGKLDGEGESKS